MISFVITASILNITIFSLTLQGGPNKSEDERITDMITIMWNVEDNEKYLKLLEALAEEYDELVDLLTGMDTWLLVLPF